MPEILTNITPVPGTEPRDDFWALARSAVYLRGKGVTFGPPLLSPNAINANVYSIPIAPQKIGAVAAQDKTLEVFADNSLDHVLVTPILGQLDDPRALLEEAARKLKMGGHLILLTLVNCDENGQVQFNPESTRELLRSIAHWRIKEDMQGRGKHLLILKKVEGRKGLDASRARAGKRACIARYGALGDAIILTPLIRQLKKDGYEVTLNISTYCSPVFENNPHIDNILIQERDLIPNHLLGRYWDHWSPEYELYINLSESLEGDLLIVEGRPPFFSSKEWRHSRCNKNYYEYTMQRAGYKLDSVSASNFRGELFFTRAEERRAQEFWQTLRGKFVIVWAMNGSSHHKVYPMQEALLREWFRDHEDARCVTVGDEAARMLEFPHFQCIPRAGKWSIRESLISTKYAQVVIGPETMITNAAGCFPTPKIVLLSHSTHENLTKYFENDHSLSPDVSSAPCYPCHQLHYTKESCPIGEMEDTSSGSVLGQAPICSISISPQRVMAELDSIYAEWKYSSRGASV